MSWELVNGLTVLPSIEFASGRTTMEAATASGDTPGYYDLKGYVTATLRVEYAVNEHVTLGIGARNLFDEYYTLTDGFPEPGRCVFMTARGRF